MTLQHLCAESVPGPRPDIRLAVLGAALLVALGLTGCDRPGVNSAAVPVPLPVAAPAAPASAPAVSIYELTTPKRLP